MFVKPAIPWGVFLIFIMVSMMVTWFALDEGEIRQEKSLFGHYYLGDEITTPTVTLTVHGVRSDAKGTGPLVPKKGYEFIIADVTFQNNTEKPFDLAPLLFFHIKDDTGKVYNVTAVPTQTNQLSGPVLPHDKVREEIGFEVIKDAKEPVLYFETGRRDYPVIAVDLDKKSFWDFVGF